LPVPHRGSGAQQLAQAGRAGQADVFEIHRNQPRARSPRYGGRVIGAGVGGHHDPHPQAGPLGRDGGNGLAQRGQAGGQQLFFVVRGHHDTNRVDHSAWSL